MSKFMLIMRDNDETAIVSRDVPFEEMLEAMGKYNESMIKAGVLVNADGLTDPAEGVVVDYSATPPIATDGPYGETKELFNGFWTLEVPTIEEATEWAKRAPLGAGSKMEIRRIHGNEDFPTDNEWIQKEAEWRQQLGTE
ncbi:YciI family protein [Microbacterium gubbeenense]|uniref:YciI family protein n=1 Tax=Microbacterium gubbeenense TaxID=159896 RepID=UPI000413A2B8|nr:YciI family protein [Microbacterium gubbeenense]